MLRGVLTLLPFSLTGLLRATCCSGFSAARSACNAFNDSLDLAENISEATAAGC